MVMKDITVLQLIKIHAALNKNDISFGLFSSYQRVFVTSVYTIISTIWAFIQYYIIIIVS